MSAKLYLYAALALAACTPQGPGGAPDDSSARKERLLVNLKQDLPQLERFEPSIAEIKRGAHGLDEVRMVIQTPQGPTDQLILATPDDKQVFVVARGPIDGSRSPKDIARDLAKKRDEVAKGLREVTQNAPARGNPDAPVTIVEFSDFQCPYCRRGSESVEQLLSRRKDVRLVFMHYPLPFHEWAKPAAIAAECAAQQNVDAFWKLHDAFFAAQEQVTPQNVLDKSEEVVARAGIDVKTWASCARDESSPQHKRAAERVDAGMAAAERFGVEGTPAFFIEGQMIGGAVPVEELEREVETALKRRG